MLYIRHGRRQEASVDHQDVIKVMTDPIAQNLLGSAIPIRLAYTGLDGYPRAVPLAFHWNGEQIISHTVPDSPKVRALRANPKIALTIDTEGWGPPQALLVRGTASVEVVDGVPPEFFAGTRKQMADEQFTEFVPFALGLYKQMARIAITPEWAKLLDFETKVPEAIARLLAH
jgi:hypothetical protein